MATGVVSNQRNTSAFKPPNLPNIEHPMARLGDKKSLKLFGSNRPDSVGSVHSAGGRGVQTPPSVGSAAGRASVVGLHAWDEPVDHSNLPPLQRDGGAESKRSKKHKHSRMMTWPPGHENGLGERRAKSAKVPNSSEYVSRCVREPDELIQMLRSKLPSGFQGLRQMFRGHDPQGKGRASRSAMGQILYPLIGFVTHEDISRLLHRLGLNENTLTFDDFIACFRDTEVVQREWLSPIARKEVSAERRRMHPEEHLRDRERGPIIERCTAAYASALLKEKCKHSDFDIRRYLPAVCFEPGAVILAPQLQECLNLMGAQLDDYEMEKLWFRYDSESTGALDSAWFFIQVGLDTSGQYNPRARTTTPASRRQKYARSPRTPKISEEVEDGMLIESPRISTPPSISRPLNSRQGPPRTASSDIMSFITRKLEQGCNNMLVTFQAADMSGNGLVGIEQFMKVMTEYGIPIQYIDAEMLLERCGMRRKDGRVMYRDLILKYMLRTEAGTTNRIIMDGTHRFNTRLNTPQGFLSVDDAEAKLVEFLHKDFLRMLGMFKTLDVYNLGLLTQRDFKDTIEKTFNTRMSKDQINEILYDYGQEDGLVAYPQFLALFNRKRFIPFKNQSSEQRPQSVAPPLTPPDASHGPRDLPQPLDDQREAWSSASSANGEVSMETSRAVIGGHKAKKMEGRYRPVSEIAAAVEIQLKKKGYTVQDSYNRLDPKYTGRLSKTQLHTWLSDMGIVLHPTELQDLWKAMDIARDGLVHYAELFDFFLHRSNRKHIADKEASMRRAKAANQPPPVRSSAELKHMMDIYKIPVATLVEKVRPDVVSNWNGLKERLKSLDPQGYATITVQDFQRLAQRFQFRLSNKELERLALSFDVNQTGNFHYMEFLQLFAESKKHSGPQGMSYHQNFHTIAHQTSKGQEKMTVSATFDKIGKKVLGSWKNARRAFKKADVNGDGHVSVADFRRILSELNIRISDDDLYYIVSEIDQDINGTISYDKFLHQIMPS